MREFKVVDCRVVYFDGISWFERRGEVAVDNTTGVSKVFYSSALTARGYYHVDDPHIQGGTTSVR